MPDEDQHIADQGDQALGEQLVDLGDIVDDAGDGDADDVGVVVAQGRFCRWRKSPARRLAEHLLADPGEQVALARR